MNPSIGERMTVSTSSSAIVSFPSSSSVRRSRAI
jgi:hypothetical protein